MPGSRSSQKSAPKKGNETQRFTYAEYRTWPEGERWELIDGEAFDMTPSGMTPSGMRTHSLTISNLAGILLAHCRPGPCEVHIGQLEVRLPKSGQKDAQIIDVVIPDIAVVCDKQKLDDAGCRGAPDFVVEVLSPSTSSHDHLRKKMLYERHGVKEYWLVDPINRIITTYLLGHDGKFGPASFFAEESKITVQAVAGLEIYAKDVFPPNERIVSQSPGKYGRKP